MAKVTIIHFNPASTAGMTRCGRDLGRVKAWTADINDATCNNCVRLETRKKP